MASTVAPSSAEELSKLYPDWSADGLSWHAFGGCSAEVLTRLMNTWFTKNQADRKAMLEGIWNRHPLKQKGEFTSNLSMMLLDHCLSLDIFLLSVCLILFHCFDRKQWNQTVQRDIAWKCAFQPIVWFRDDIWGFSGDKCGQMDVEWRCFLGRWWSLHPADSRRLGVLTQSHSWCSETLITLHDFEGQVR